MASKSKHKNLQLNLEHLSVALEQGALLDVRALLADMHPAEISLVLESLPLDEREVVWQLVADDVEGDVLAGINEEVRISLIRKMDVQEILAATEGMDADDLADIIQDLPGKLTQDVLRSMGKQDRKRLDRVLSYPEDSAGGLMNVDTVTVRADVSLDVVLRYLRLRGELPEATDSLFVVDRKDAFHGLLSISALLTNDPEKQVADVMRTDVDSIMATLPVDEVAQIFEQRDLISAPVVSEQGKLLGRITIDDVVDVIRDEAEHSLMSMAGLDEDNDMFAPVLISARRRAVWLGVNLITALIASWTIGLFEATLEKVVALAILMPIVASMGGIAGSQTLMIVIRGMALKQIGRSNARRLMMKELFVGAINGLLWALVLALIVSYWFGDPRIGLIIAAAMVINLMVAAFSGATIPMLLKKVGADPALAGGVILTTVTDVVGFVSFLGLAAIFIV